MGESRLRMVGTQFEGFREALTRLLSSRVTTTAVPTVVVVFPDEKSFDPFKPVFQGKKVDIGGLFVPRQNINYILIGPDRGPDALRAVFHEYAHLVVDNVLPGLPVWMNEGLAEYYSSFEIGNDGRAVTFGRPIDSHLRELFSETWMPINELVATAHDSPQYNENSRRGVFYAESWLLVHMLLLGKPDRTPQFSAYAKELSTGAAAEAAWHRQFDDTDIYKSLRAYSGQTLMSARRYTLSDQIVRSPGVVVPITPAGVDTALGELLLALGRAEAAGQRFDRALSTESGSVRAQIDKAVTAGAAPHTEAAPAASGDWFADYMMGVTLVERSESIDRSSLEAARLVLSRAAAVREDIPNLQVLYARANELTNGDAGSARDALAKAHAAVPVRDDYTMLLAHALARAGDFQGARSTLGELMAHPHFPDSRDVARRQMEIVVDWEKEMRRPAAASPAAASAAATAATGSSSSPEQLSRLRPVYREVGAGEQRVEGTLERIECSAARTEFVVRLADRLARFQVAKVTAVDFISYRRELQGKVACGARTPPDPVYVTFRAGDLDGTVVAIEFLPER